MRWVTSVYCIYFLRRMPLRLSRARLLTAPCPLRACLRVLPRVRSRSCASTRAYFRNILPTPEISGVSARRRPVTFILIAADMAYLGINI